MNANLSILIVNWNTRALLDACLASVYSFAQPYIKQVIVLDNNSQDGSAAMVREKYPQVELIASEMNHGFGKGNNLALAHATGDYILLLNPDTELRPDTLDQAYAVLKTHASVGVVGVRQDEPSGHFQASAGNAPSLRTMLVQQWMFLAARLGFRSTVRWISRASSVPVTPVKHLHRYFDFSQTVEVDWVMGAFMLMPRAAVPRDGLFDERFVMYGEDLDLCARVKKNGFKVFYCGSASILHHGGASTRTVPVKADAMHFVAMIEYYRKHQPGSAGLYRLFLGAGSLLTALSGLIRRRSDLTQRGLARFRMAKRPGWAGFLQK